MFNKVSEDLKVKPPAEITTFLNNNIPTTKDRIKLLIRSFGKLAILWNTKQKQTDKQDILENVIEIADQLFEEETTKGDNQDINIILNKLEQLEETIQQQREKKVKMSTYAEVTAKPRKEFKMLITSNGGSVNDPGKLIGEIVNKDKKIKIKDTFNTHKGLKIIVNNQTSINKVKDVVREIDENLKAEEVKPLLPQISIIIRKDAYENEQNIKERNGFADNEEFKEIYKTAFNARRREAGKPVELIKIVYRLSRNIKQQIDQNGLYIMFEKPRVKDHFNIRACTKCYLFGHTRRNCRQENEVIMDNKNDKGMCNFCNANKKDDYKHKAYSKECNMWQEATNKLKAMIDYHYEP